MFKPPPHTEYNFISLGAGVQSSTMALMAAKGEIKPMPDGAIFADTQAEPKNVYEWLAWLTDNLPFPVHTVTKGDLTKTALELRNYTKDPSRKGQWTKSLLPVYTLEPDGTKGHMQRACTFDYKVTILEKTQRKLGKIKRGQKETTVTSWVGISTDEIERMKLARHSWVQNRYPLIEMRMTRQDCLKWMENNGYPQPPRSACVYCPYHSNAEWNRLRTEEPEEFERAVKFEKDLQKAKAETDNMRGVPYLHPSREPLDTLPFLKKDGQLDMWNDFLNECEGMCGV